MAKNNVSDVPVSATFKDNMLMPFLETVRSERTAAEYKRHILTICRYFYDARNYAYDFNELDKEDARDYFQYYLKGECRSEKISFDTFRARLSAANSFGDYLQSISEKYPELDGYENPFGCIIRPPVDSMVRSRMLSLSEIDEAISCARGFNEMLYVMFLLSYRMVMLESVLLDLKKDQFTFLDENGRIVGVVMFMRKGEQLFNQIPADIVQDVMTYVTKQPDGYVFRNSRGNRMNRENLRLLLKKFSEHSGVSITLKSVRTRSLTDLVAVNPDASDEIADYSGLSKRMVLGYAPALDRIGGGCIMDKAPYKILSPNEEQE